MIKDKLTEAVKASLNDKNGNDHVPLGMRGELEVIVKDRDGNVKSYEREHNQVTKLAKQAIIHLLAGEIGTVDSNIYSISGTVNQRTYQLETAGGQQIYSTFVPENHSTSTNLDGQLVSGEQFFYQGSKYLSGATNLLSQVAPNDFGNVHPIRFNFPTKMLFGTGLEAYDNDNVATVYAAEMGADTLTTSAILKLNGYAQGGETWGTNFMENCSNLTDWYSANAYRCRTLQPPSTSPMNTLPASTDTAIKGAIKNCLITSTEDVSKYNATTKMAMPNYRGFGYPCFIYAQRSTESFYKTSNGNNEVHYSMNDTLQNEPYEVELTYTVIMPTQPVASNSITTFYPYNGWVIRQAGLFCDSRYALRSSSDYTEQSFVASVNSTPTTSETVKTYRDSVGGMMLFTRNLSSTILKTPDDEVTFIWHIFITV